MRLTPDFSEDDRGLSQWFHIYSSGHGRLFFDLIRFARIKFQVEGFGGRESGVERVKKETEKKIMIRSRKAIYCLYATILNVRFFQQFVLHGQTIFIVLSAVVSDYIHELFYDSELSAACSYYIVKLIYFFWSNMIMHWYVVYNLRFILVSWL